MSKEAGWIYLCDAVRLPTVKEVWATALALGTARGHIVISKPTRSSPGVYVPLSLGASCWEMSLNCLLLWALYKDRSISLRSAWNGKMRRCLILKGAGSLKHSSLLCHPSIRKSHSHSLVLARSWAWHFVWLGVSPCGEGGSHRAWHFVLPGWSLAVKWG